MQALKVMEKLDLGGRLGCKTLATAQAFGSAIGGAGGNSSVDNIDGGEVRMGNGGIGMGDLEGCYVITCIFNLYFHHN